MKRLQFIERASLIGFTGFSVIFLCLIILAQWPEWWKWVIPEMAPMTWLEHTLLYTTALLGFGSMVFAYLRKEDRKAFYWALYGLGFSFLALDERFALHERVRDRILEPMNVRIPFLPWVSAGDFLLLGVMILGLALLPKILGLFQERRSALVLFLIGVSFSVIAVVFDSFDFHGYSLMAQRWQQCIEECIETAGMLCFLNASLLIFLPKLGHTAGKHSD